MWSSWAWVMTMPTRSFFTFSMKARSGIKQIDAGQLVAGEAEAEVDHQPLAAARRAEAVERAIHADLAETAKRREDQFVAVAHRSVAFLADRRLCRRREIEIGRLDRLDAGGAAQQQAAALVERRRTRPRARRADRRPGSRRRGRPHWRPTICGSRRSPRRSTHRPSASWKRVARRTNSASAGTGRSSASASEAAG